MSCGSAFTLDRHDRACLPINIVRHAVGIARQNEHVHNVVAAVRHAALPRNAVLRAELQYKIITTRQNK